MTAQEDNPDPPQDDEPQDDDFEDDAQENEEEDEGDEDEGDEGEGDEEEGDEEDQLNEEEELENEVRHLEVNLGRMEVVHRLAEIAGDELNAAAFAMMRLEDFFESDDEGITYFESVSRNKQASPAVRRLAKMKLSEMYSWMDEDEAAMRVLKSMVVSSDD